MTERLWAIWRMEYILGEGKKEEGCFLCTNQSKPKPQVYILAKQQVGYVMLNKYPYTPGHIMVVPSKHIKFLTELNETELLHFSKLIRDSIEALKIACNPQGINLGINWGRCAGAGIEDHLHVHIVPRWNGDTNFMPVLADVRVLPEKLTTTWERFYPYFKHLDLVE